MTETANGDVIRQQIDSYIVKKSPKNSSLESMLSTYTKDQLSILIDANEFSIAKSKRKAEVVAELSDAIIGNLENSTTVKDEETFSKLEYLLSDLPVNLDEGSWSKKDATLLETMVSEGVALVTSEEIYVADEIVSKINEIKKSSKDSDSSHFDNVKQSAPAAKEEKKVVYKQQAIKIDDLNKQKQQRQSFLKKMAKKKKKGKKRK